MSVFKTLIATVISYFECPGQLKQFTLIDGVPPAASDLTLSCFNEYLTLFNSIPGQPVKNLTDLISTFQYVLRANQFATLDLSNKGLNGFAIAEILQAFSRYQIPIRNLNLSGNVINSPPDVAVLMPQLLPIVDLDLSNNQFGSKLSSGGLCSEFTVPSGLSELSEGLSKLTRLTSLILANNLLVNSLSLPFADSFGLSFEKLVHLRKLDLSGSYIFFLSAIFGFYFPNSLRRMTKLEELNLSGAGLGLGGDGDNMHHLAPNLALLTQLRYLNLSQNSIGMYSCYGVNGTQMLSHALRSLQSLQILDLSWNEIGYCSSNDTRSLAEAFKTLTNLRELYLAGNNIGFRDSVGEEALADSIWLLNIRYIDLSGNQIGNTSSVGANALADALKTSQQLQQINIMPVANVSNALALIEALQQSSIRSNLPVFITPTQALQYLEPRKNATIITLSNKLVGLPVETWQVFMNNLSQLSHLTQLDLSQNHIGYQGPQITQVIGESLANLTKLQILDLSENDIGFTESIASSLSLLVSLRELNLAGNDIGQYGSGVESLIMSIVSLQNLESLDLSRNLLDYNDNIAEQMLGLYLSNLKNLVNLNLGKNWIGSFCDSGIQILGKSLASLKKLRSFDLSGPPAQGAGSDLANIGYIGFFNTAGVEMIARSISTLSDLESINLSGNSIGSTGSAGVIALFNAFVTLRELNLRFINVHGMNTTGIPWTQAAQILIQNQDDRLRQACGVQACFGGELNPTSLSNQTPNSSFNKSNNN